jgi:hypothetical protein
MDAEHVRGRAVTYALRRGVLNWAAATRVDTSVPVTLAGNIGKKTKSYKVSTF